MKTPSTRPRSRRARLAAVLTAGAALFLGSVVAAPSASAINGLEFVLSPSLTGPQATLTQSAQCPAGKVVYGGGGYTNDDGRFHLSWMQPVHTSSGDSFLVRAESVGRTSPGFNWTVRAWAICGNPVSGLEYVHNTQASTSSNLLDSHVKCSLGKKLLGIGGRVSSSTGRVVMDDMVPYNDLTGAYVRGYEVEGGDPNSWNATVYGVCADPVAGQTIVSNSTAYDSNPSKYQSVQCPAGKSVHGIGGDILNGVGQVTMVEVAPPSNVGNNMTLAGIRGHEDVNGYTGNWSARVWVICAT